MEKTYKKKQERKTFQMKWKEKYDFESKIKMNQKYSPIDFFSLTLLPTTFSSTG